MKRLDSLWKCLFAGLAALLLASCAHMATPEMQWHPLAGKVWDVEAQRFVDPMRVIERATDTRFVMIGEIHDNAEHHRIQSRILDALIMRDRRPALVLEQYDIEQQDKLNQLAQGRNNHSEKLAGLGELMRTGWEWRYYKPMISRALHEKLPIIAGNFSREALRAVAREGYGVLGAGQEERLALAEVWSEEKQAQMTHEIAAGHCGKVADHVVEYVTRSQRARDAVMADKMIMAKRNGVVALFGRNHTRLDIGVPLYLAARAPGEDMLSIGLIELDTPTDPRAYTDGALGRQHHYLWFTTRPVRNQNPCDSIPAQPKAAA